MTSPVDVSNAALTHLGADAAVASIDPPDGSAEAGYCARFYPLARTELLDTFHFSFAKRRIELAEVTSPSTTWSYAYGLPSAMMNALRVLRAGQADEDEHASAAFVIEGDTLFTHEPEAVLIYTVDVVDLSKFSASAVTALGYLLAAYLAGPLVKGTEGANLAAKLRQIAGTVARAAAAANANNAAEPGRYVSLLTQARE